MSDNAGARDKPRARANPNFSTNELFGGGVTAPSLQIAVGKRRGLKVQSTNSAAIL